MQLFNAVHKRILNARAPDLRVAWRPYLIFLRFLGIVNWHSDVTVNPWRNPWTITGILCLLNTWSVLFIRLKMLKLTEASTKTELASFSIRIISVWRNDLQKVFSLWSQLQLRTTSLQRLESQVKKASWCILCMFLVLSITQVTAYQWIAFQKSLFKVYEVSILLRTLSLFVSMHMMGFIVLVCVTLCLLLAEVNSIIQAEKAGHANLKSFNTLFQLATEIVSTFDSVLAFVIGPYILSFVCQVVFNTYIVIQNQSTIYGLYNEYWMVESAVMLLIVSLFPAMVNVQAHRSYQVLCRVATEDIPMPLLLLVNGLQTRLSVSSIGLSGFHIQVITINVIPSMISIYFTYIILIIQFRSSDIQAQESLV